MNRTIVSVLCLPALLALAGCGQGSSAKPAGPPLAGARIGGPFRLIDQHGQTVTDASFAGKYRIMYFGYSFCPDVCPTDMQHLGVAMRMLDRTTPALSAKIVPVFVSVDPERDTPDVLGKFVAAFYPRMVGLTGTPAQIRTVAKEYAVFYKKEQTPGAAGYLVQHSDAAYLMGPDGAPIALVPVEKSPETIVATLREWVK